MGKRNDFIISFSGLKLGKHAFSHELEKTFFDKFISFGIIDGSGSVSTVLDKKETMLMVEFTITSNTTMECGRCNGPVAWSFNEKIEIIYKFGLEESDDEALIVIPFEAYELNIEQPLFDAIAVKVPLRIIHDEADCDPAVIQWLSQQKKEEILNDKSIDPRWDVLNKIKKEKK